LDKPDHQPDAKSIDSPDAFNKNTVKMLIKEYNNMSEHAKMKLDNKLGAAGSIGMYNGKRVLF